MPHPRLRFPFARPAVPPPDAWLGHLQVSYDERWFSNRGPLVERLEGALAARDPQAGRDAATVASATAGLVATLLALDVQGPVALPAFTFPATAHAVRLAGCTPILCDVDPGTWELAPSAAERAVRRHGAVAILHVRSFGLCRDLGAMEAVAAEAGVPLVVDAAASFGGTDDAGVPAGRAGVAEVFSFHATKVFAAGEGGAVLAAPELAEQIHHVSNFALAGGADVTGPALNAKMSELTAAVALAMLDALDEHIAHRRLAAARLLEAVDAAGIAHELPAHPGHPPHQGLPILLRDPATRRRAVAALHRTGVEARRYYAPGLHRTSAFGGTAAGALPVTDDLAGRMLCLPLYSDLGDTELDELATLVHDALATAAREEAHGVPGR